MQVFRLAARVVIGSLFVGHGTQKLFGWFGGPGLEGTDQMMDSLKLQPQRRNTVAAGATETAGGALLVLGLATPLAASGLIGVMLTAIRTVHWPNGVWNSNGGFEYNATLIAALAALAESGPGDLSLDALMGQAKGSWWKAAAAVGGGVAASVATFELGRMRARQTAELAEPFPVEPQDQQESAPAEDR